MGFDVLSELQLWSRGANARLHSSILSLFHHPPKRTLGLAALDDDTVEWLQPTTVYSAFDDAKSAHTKKTLFL